MNVKKGFYFNKASTIVALSIILGTVTYAWTGPTDVAPNGNVPAPINVGTLLQEKMGSLKVRGPFTITGGNKGYSELTQDADDPSTLVTKSYVDSKVGSVSVSSGGNSSPYCAYSGQSKSTNPSTPGVSSACGMTVDDTGYQNLSSSISVYEDGNGSRSWYSCSDSKYNADSAGCQYSGIAFNGPITATFNRTTGVLTCSVIYGGNNVISTVTFTKDQSKCSGSSSFTESDPTVLASVKDGVSWSEVTGKPSISSVPGGGVFIMTSCPSGWAKVGNWGTIQDQTGIGGINVYQCQAP